MIATTNSTPVAVGKSSGFASLAEASRFLGVSPTTCRSLFDSGELSGYLTPGSHRKYEWGSLRRFCGYDVAEHQTTGQHKAIAYVRCSSDKQALAGSQARQLERVVSEVMQRESCTREQIAIYQDTASAFGCRQGLNRMVSHIVDGVVSGRLYVEYQDRLARDSVLHLVEFICQSKGIEIVYIDTVEKNPDELAAGFQEALAFVNVVVNRINGRKAGKVVGKSLNAATIARAKEMRKAAVPIQIMVQRLNDEGYKLTKVDGTEHPVTQHSLRKLFCGERTLREAIVGSEPDIVEWSKTNLVETGNHSLKCSEVYDAFRAFAKNRGTKIAKSNAHLARLLKFRSVAKHDGRYFIGVRFADDNTPQATVDTVDSVGAFLERRVLKTDENVFVYAKQVMAEYRIWCKDNNLQAESTHVMSKRLRSLASKVVNKWGTLAFFGLRVV